MSDSVKSDSMSPTEAIINEYGKIIIAEEEQTVSYYLLRLLSICSSLRTLNGFSVKNINIGYLCEN